MMSYYPFSVLSFNSGMCSVNLVLASQA